MAMHARLAATALALTATLALAGCRADVTEPVAGGGTPTPSATATDPVGGPTEEPTQQPTVEPSQEPTATPSGEPTAEPSQEPTAEPSQEPTSEPSGEPGDGAGVPAAGYAEQLELIRSQSFRNTAPDGWEYRDTAQAEIPDEAYLGPRSEYPELEGAFPDPAIGGFRIECEVSHLAYDDPLVHPGKPGAAHLHMFFGNTDVNAFTTADSLRNSGSSSCNGFVRNGYWAPAVFDGEGNVRMPEFVRVYYKGFGPAVGSVQPYPQGMAMVSDDSINKSEDGAFAFRCIDTYGGSKSQEGEAFPTCTGGTNPDNGRNMIEVNVKFDNCWNGEDPSNYEDNLVAAQYSWYSGICPETHPIELPNLEYLMRYLIEDGEDTSRWFLASDVDPMTFEVREDRGGSNHADWWGAWDPEINKTFLDNCTNVRGADCGHGFLDNGGNDGTGPTLKRRAESNGPSKVPAEQVFEELCPVDREITAPQQAALCDTGPMMAGMEH